MAGGLIEIYAEIAVDMADDPKVRALARYGRSARPARDLYVQMILYCKRTLSDGFVPDEQIGVLVYPDPPSVGAREADYLAEVGLIHRQGQGWVVSAFLRRNKSRAEVEAEAAGRAEKGVRGNHDRWHVSRGVVKDDCPLCLARRSPPRSPPDRTGDPPTIPNGSPPRSPPRSPNDRTDDIDRRSIESPETETETETTTGLFESVGARGRARPTRGHRLPEDFPPTADMIEWAQANAPNVGRAQHEAFCDYWRAQPGQRGVKVDWPATWRNWMRREQEKRANGAGPARASTTDQRVQAGLELAAELRANETRELPQ